MHFYKDGFLILVLSVCLFVFFSHGVLYYFFQEQHYVEGGTGWLQYLKYFIFFFVIIFSVTLKGFSKSNLKVFLLVQTFGLMSFFVVDSYEKVLLTLSFLIPTLCLLLPFGWISRNIDKVKHYFYFLSLFLIFVNFFSLLYEVVYGPLIDTYSRGAFRATGIFINPNNSSIFLVFLYSFACYIASSKWFKVFLSLVVFLCLFLMGSKTGFFIFSVVVTFFVVKSLVRFFWVASVLSVVFLWFSITGVEIFSFDYVYRNPLDFDSAFIRFDDWAKLGGSLYSVSIIELFFGRRDVYLVDNTYMDVFSNFGFLMLMFFCFLNFSFLRSSLGFNKYVMLFNLIFLAAAVTTNVHRLWPVAYVYWGLMGWTFYCVRNYTKTTKVS